MTTLRSALPLLLLPALALLTAPAQAAGPDLPTPSLDECPHPWVVVVRKDGSVTEGRLIKDIEKGVLVDVGGHAQLVKEDDIDEVVEDCSRGAPPPAAAAPLPPVAPAAPVAPLAPHPPRPAAPPPRAENPPSVKKKVLAAEADFRNTLIGYTQQSIRWAGGGCVSLGCGLCSTGVVFALLSLVYGVTGNGLTIWQSLVVAPLLLAMFGLAAALFVGSGGGMLLSAQLLDLLRPERGPDSPAPPMANSLGLPPISAPASGPDNPVVPMSGQAY